MVITTYIYQLALDYIASWKRHCPIVYGELRGSPGRGFVDVYWKCPMDVQWHFPMELHFCKFWCVILRGTKGVPRKGVWTSVNMRVWTCKQLRVTPNETNGYLWPPFLGTPLVPSRVQIEYFISCGMAASERIAMSCGYMYVCMYIYIYIYTHT